MQATSSFKRAEELCSFELGAFDTKLFYGEWLRVELVVLIPVDLPALVRFLSNDVRSISVEVVVAHHDFLRVRLVHRNQSILALAPEFVANTPSNYTICSAACDRNT